jgi:hypothetical protein
VVLLLFPQNQCFGENAASFFKMVGFFTMTMLLLTSPFPFKSFWPKKNIPVVSHPPYSPDLAPCDFFLFPKIKMKLKGQRFYDIPTIQQNVTSELDNLKVEDFQ